tara:strand:+ start:612 stop:827 length:216 start_codon:yes stop_codon:yes gene_type:complete
MNICAHAVFLLGIKLKLVELLLRLGRGFHRLVGRLLRGDEGFIRSLHVLPPGSLREIVIRKIAQSGEMILS